MLNILKKYYSRINALIFDVKNNKKEEARKFQLLLEACLLGNLDVVRDLLTSHPLLVYDKLHVDDNVLSYACRNGHLEIVKYLLSSPEIKNLDIHKHDDDALIIACIYGHLDIVSYLLTSEDLKEHANIHAQGNKALIEAYYSNEFDIMKYLLTSEDLKEHANIHINEDYIFKEGSKRTQFDSESKFTEYLILDYQIKKTSDIEAYLLKEDRKDLLNIFAARELHNKLNISLKDKRPLTKNSTLCKL